MICEVVPPRGESGPRVKLERQENRLFVRMNANAYLGLSLDAEMIEAEERAVRTFGTGPGAVRFISGPATSLIKRLRKKPHNPKKEATDEA